MSQPPPAAASPAIPQMRWLAIACEDPQAIGNALHLQNVQRATLQQGLDPRREPKVFIAPPQNGWTLVLGSELPSPGAAELLPWFPDHATPLLSHLSRTLAPVQYFDFNRYADLFAWARAENGKIKRSYAFSGSRGARIWNRGQQTPEEQDLYPNIDAVTELASRWSVDPRTLYQNQGNAEGYVADWGLFTIKSTAAK